MFINIFNQSFNKNLENTKHEVDEAIDFKKISIS